MGLPKQPDCLRGRWLMKKLIYYCHFGGIEYLKLLFMSIVSLRLISSYSGDIIVFTDNLTKTRSLFNQTGFDSVKVIKLSSNRPLFNRYKIPEEIARQYDSVMYLDSDIIVLNNPDKILSKVKKDTFHYSTEIDSLIFGKFRTNLKWYGDNYYTADDLKVRPIISSSGLFAFNPSDTVMNFLNLVAENATKVSFEDYIVTGDQPMFCYLLSKSISDLTIDDSLLADTYYVTNGIRVNKRLVVPFIHCNGFTPVQTKVSEMFFLLKKENINTVLLDLIERVIKSQY